MGDAEEIELKENERKIKGLKVKIDVLSNVVSFYDDDNTTVTTC